MHWVCAVQSPVYRPWIGQPAAKFTNASAILLAIQDQMPYSAAWDVAQLEVVAYISGIIASSNMLAYEVLQQVGRSSIYLKPGGDIHGLCYVFVCLGFELTACMTRNSTDIKSQLFCPSSLHQMLLVLLFAVQCQ